MRNGGLSEARCQNEVSESKAAAASSMTSKVRRSRRVTVFFQAGGVPLVGKKIDNGRRAIQLRPRKACPECLGSFVVPIKSELNNGGKI
jgi:ribosomal protein L44E